MGLLAGAAGTAADAVGTGSAMVARALSVEGCGEMEKGERLVILIGYA